MGGTLTICAQDLTVRNRRTFNAMNYFNEKWSWSREPDRERIAVGTCSCAGAGASTSTGILRPGEIALMTVRHGGGDPYYVRESLMPFFEEIQDFEHLIIDMREHSGGGRFHFMESKMRPLISEPIYINYVKFFTGEGYASWMIENNLHFRNQLQSTEVRVHNAAEFVAERGMMYFNQDDLQYLV
ncbi:MAG: hypothetical protein LBE35_04965, partial [Clostridiales bacterium]|nr:hypothetical protein [Clostridiales bacterium]